MGGLRSCARHAVGRERGIFLAVNEARELRNTKSEACGTVVVRLGTDGPKEWKKNSTETSGWRLEKRRSLSKEGTRLGGLIKRGGAEVRECYYSDH